MLFVKGVKGNRKLNPAIKLWGGIMLLILVVALGIVSRFDVFRSRVEACEAKGGDWIGGALVSAFCEPASEREREFD
jgi:hypothetical protein